MKPDPNPLPPQVAADLDHMLDLLASRLSAVRDLAASLGMPLAVTDRLYDAEHAVSNVRDAVKKKSAAPNT